MKIAFHTSLSSLIFKFNCISSWSLLSSASLSLTRDNSLMHELRFVTDVIVCWATFQCNVLCPTSYTEMSFENNQSVMAGFSLVTVFSALKLTQNCNINMNIFFLKTDNLIIYWLRLSNTHTTPERLILNLTKYESKRTFITYQSGWKAVSSDTVVSTMTHGM